MSEGSPHLLQLRGLPRASAACTRSSDDRVPRRSRRGRGPGRRQRRRQEHAAQDDRRDPSAGCGRDRRRRAGSTSSTDPARPAPPGSPPCTRTSPCATTSTSSATCSWAASCGARRSPVRRSTCRRWRSGCGPSSASLGVRVPSLRAPVARLSGGQRQGIAIGRALLGEPSVVQLDEPTAALGVAQRQHVLELILRLREQDRGVIVVSHDLRDVQQIADRVVVLAARADGGRVPARAATTPTTSSRRSPARANR